MSVRRSASNNPTAGPAAPQTRLAAVLAAGQARQQQQQQQSQQPVEVVPTGGFFGPSDPLEKFRKALTELDDKKAKEKINKATGNKLSAEQFKTLAAEYAQAEAKAWEEVAKVGTYEDYFKERKANIKALEALLRAQAGLGALYEYDQYKSVKVMPNRPDLPPIYKYHLWPSYRVKKGTVPWNDYRSIRDAWKAADQLMITTGNRE